MRTRGGAAGSPELSCCRVFAVFSCCPVPVARACWCCLPRPDAPRCARWARPLRSVRCYLLLTTETERGRSASICLYKMYKSRNGPVLFSHANSHDSGSRGVNQAALGSRHRHRVFRQARVRFELGTHRRKERRVRARWPCAYAGSHSTRQRLASCAHSSSSMTRCCVKESESASSTASSCLQTTASGLDATLMQ